jgi:hypothetical protein
MPRPRKQEPERQTHKVVAYVSAETKEAIRDAARSLHVSESQLAELAMEHWLAEHNDGGAIMERTVIYPGPTQSADLTGPALGADVIREIEARVLARQIAEYLNKPETLFASEHQEVMRATSVSVAGYLCPQGHPFWIESALPALPRRCPVCGTESGSFRSTWNGTVQREARER